MTRAPGTFLGMKRWKLWIFGVLAVAGTAGGVLYTVRWGPPPRRFYMKFVDVSAGRRLEAVFHARDRVTGRARFDSLR